MLWLAATITPTLHGATTDQGSARYVRASWTSQDGLPSSVVTAIAQDKDGYLWLGSFAGLVRFDGMHFVHWNAVGKPVLPETLIHALCASRDGSLWIGFGNRGGVGRIENGSLRHFGPQDGLPEATVVTLVEDHEGTIWAGGLSGLAKFRHKRWEQLGVRHGLSQGTTVDGLFVDQHGILYVASSAGVLRRGAQDNFEPIETGSSGVLDVTTDKAGFVWGTGPQQTFSQLQARRHHARSQLLDGVNGARLLRDRRNQLWVATMGQGLLHVRSDQWADSPETQWFTRQHGLTSNRVISLFEDREGNVWVGTSRGLDRFTPYDSANPVASIPEFDGLSVQAVTIAKDGSIWVGTTHGLAHLSDQKLTWARERDGLPSAVIKALHADKNGDLWIATPKGPALRHTGGRISSLPFPGGQLLTRISAMTTDPEGGLWLCDFDGIYRWKDGALTKVAIIPSMERKQASVAYTDTQGRVWIGFAGGGLVVFENGRFTAYSENDGLTKDTVIAIYQDGAGTMWIGTHHGLSKFATGRFTTLALGSGLPGNRLMAVLADNEGGLWMGTDIGFVRIKPGEFDKAVNDVSYRISYHVVDVSDGVDGIPITQGNPNSVRVKNGALWFVSTTGMTVVDPQALRDYRLPPPPRIERVLADERALPPAETRLPPRTARLQVDYTSLAFADASRLRFRYRLEGNDTEWVYAGTRRQAFYTNLSPASYRFRVAARIGDGAWVESGGPWEFSIQPALYQTAWFYVACAVAAATASWSAWRYRLRQVRRKYSLVIAERTRLAREIHDTLLQGMAGVALQLHSISQAADSLPTAAKERCERARDCLEHYMREARYAIWNLRSPSLEGTDFVGALRHTADEITAGSTITCSVRVLGNRFRCVPRVEDHILRICREAIRNAVRHAQATHVRVELRYERPSVILRVFDDGRGFDPDDLARTQEIHYGLEGVREHAELVGGRFRLTTVSGGGTEIEVIIPATQ